jgi:hypothetical protein
MKTATNPTRTSARIDALIVAIVTALFAWLSVELEIGERVLAWTQPREHYQLDELPGVLLVLAIGLAWFSWCRAADAGAELRERRGAERGSVRSARRASTPCASHRRHPGIGAAHSRAHPDYERFLR